MKAESGKILIFGGTTEGRTVAERLLAEGLPCTVCVATQYGEEVLHPHPLMNVHTVPALRRKGIAARMVSILIEEAWSRGVTEISLDATEAGRPLYRKLGFHDSGEYMVLEKENT